MRPRGTRDGLAVAVVTAVNFASAAVFVLLLASCASDPAEPTGTDAGIFDAAVPDAQVQTRGFLLATAGIQARTGGSTLFQHAVPLEELAQDSDVLEIHEEFYGIPWEAFESNEAPPAEWSAAIEALASAAKASGKPVFLNTLIGRQHLAPRTRIRDGKVETEDLWSASCYDFASAIDGDAKKQAYLRYVEYMVETFEPRWMNPAVETNLFFQACPDAWEGMLDVANAAYDAVKAIDDDIIVFPSFAIGALYGLDCEVPDDCYEANYAAIAPLKRDRFAVSTYPYLDEMDVEDIPSDWFTRAADREGETVIIAETGWNRVASTARFGEVCAAGIAGGEGDQREYLRRLLAEGEKNSVEMIVWWSNRDLLPEFLMTDCPCDDDAAWCTVVEVFRAAAGSEPVLQFIGELNLKIWGTMGLRDYDGEPNESLFPTWKEAFDLPVDPALLAN